jgi:hypothetical protein
MYRALVAYRDDAFTPINAQLRGGNETPAVSRQISAMDDAMKASPLTSDVQVFRGLADARSMFGDRVDSDLTGLVWREDAFVSTSVDRKGQPRFAEDGSSSGTPMVMQIAVPKGTPAVAMTPIEAELLMDRGRSLKVTADRGMRDGIRVIEVEVVP